MGKMHKLLTSLTTSYPSRYLQLKVAESYEEVSLRCSSDVLVWY
jgi:hypothetical protein